MRKKSLFVLFLPIVLFILLTILILSVDKANIGEANVEVGLSSINDCLNGSYNIKVWDVISDICMGIGIFLIVAMAGFGIYQLIKRKSLFKVDKLILTLGVLIIVVLGLWILFDKLCVINYRPILIDGEKEGSYPSTHVMLVSFMVISSSWILRKNVDKKMFKILAYIVSAILIIIVFIGRLLSGMHWFTDVVGGLLLGSGLSFILIFIDCYFLSKEKI